MSHSVVMPRTLLPSTSLTGAGARALLLDSGIAGTTALPNVAVLSCNPPRPESQHAARGASIAVGPSGMAPASRAVTADYRPWSLAGHERTIAEAGDWLGGTPHVVSHGYSVPEDSAWVEGAHALFRRLVNHALHIGSPGHDGPGRIRFPGSCAGVVTVGVSRNGRLDPRCGTSSTKPDLTVPDSMYHALDEAGNAVPLGGTSAGVNLVVGAACLLVEGFMQAHGCEPSPLELRALLLACRDSTTARSLRFEIVVAPSLTARTFEGASQVRLRLSPCSGFTGVAVLAIPTHEPECWQPALGSAIKGASSDLVVEGGDYATLLLPPHAGPLSLHLSVHGPVAGMVVACTGAERAFIDTRRTAPPRSSEPIVLGMACSHDAAACLVQGDRVLAGIQLERVTRIKRDGLSFLSTRRAADYCLAAAGIRATDVDLFAFNSQPLLPGYAGLNQPVADAGFDLFDPFGSRALFVSHHLAHAFSAYFLSPFPSAAVYVVDGSGGSTVGCEDAWLPGPQLRDYLRRVAHAPPPLHVSSLYEFASTGFKLIGRETAPSFNVRCGSSSLGESYAAVANYVFGDWHASGKLMGLAPYGDPCAMASMLREDDQLPSFAAEWKLDLTDAMHKRSPLEYRDLAARVQRDLELALLARFKHIRSQTHLPIAYAGGVALNSAANDRVVQEAQPTVVFLVPAAHDAGTAIGAAAAGVYHLTGTMPKRTETDDFYGYSYSTWDIETALRSFDHCVHLSDYDEATVVRLLSDNHVLGWFESSAEFGPRALGHRSILANPATGDMWRHINQKVKFREDFRPFAPVVPAEAATKYFELTGESPYMLRVVRVRPEYRERLGAVTHVNGTARVQTVSPTAQPRLHRVLKRIGEATGIPVLLNTSLNVRGEPIVETPTQALRVLMGTMMDAMVLGDRLVVPIHCTPADPHALAPGVTLISEAQAGAAAHRFLRVASRGDATYALDPLVYEYLTRCEHVSAATYAQSLGVQERTLFEQELSALIRLRLVVAGRSTGGRA